MAELEKVIRGLECCLNTGNFEECTENCPYFTKKLGVGVCSENMQRDALSLLKAQKPRVMTLDEVKQAKGRDVWLELSGNIAEDVITAATIEGCGTGGICTRYESLNYAQYCVKPYGWRCWTSRPTDEQRKKVKWNG